VVRRNVDVEIEALPPVRIPYHRRNCGQSVHVFYTVIAPYINGQASLREMSERQRQSDETCM
jgi:hypothetical protein